MTFVTDVIYDGIWLNDLPVKGILIIHGVTISSTWKNNKISSIEDINNDKQIIISISDILPFIDSFTIFPPSFYTLVGLSQTKPIVDSFLEKMKTYRGTVVVAAICHGELLPPIHLPILQMNRINQVVNGVCVFTNHLDKLNLIDICLSNTVPDILPIIRAQFIQTTKTQCDSKYCNDDQSDIYNKMVRNISGLTKSPEKIAKKGNLIFNKNFSSIGDNINVLLLIDEEGNHINLFSTRQNISLEEVFTMIPECSKCIFTDASCSGPGINPETQDYYKFTQAEYDSYGGKTKTKKMKIKKTKKTKKNKQL
jgi:hypothetical protein